MLGKMPLPISEIYSRKSEWQPNKNRNSLMWSCLCYDHGHDS